MPIIKITLLLFATFLWPKASFSSPLHENISATLTLTGDLSGQYELSGPLNQTIRADAATAGGCEAIFLFRKVNSKGKTMVEAWPAFSCTRDGQKKSYKLHRSYLDPSVEVQRVSVSSLDEKIKKVTMEFRDLSLQKGK